MLLILNRYSCIKKNSQNFQVFSSCSPRTSHLVFVKILFFKGRKKLSSSLLVGNINDVSKKKIVNMTVESLIEK